MRGSVWGEGGGEVGGIMEKGIGAGSWWWPLHYAETYKFEHCKLTK